LFPTNGQTVYVRLWSLISGSWHFNDTTYSNPTGASVSSAVTGLAKVDVDAGSDTGVGVALTKVSDYVGDIVQLTRVH